MSVFPSKRSPVTIVFKMVGWLVLAVMLVLLIIYLIYTSKQETKTLSESIRKLAPGQVIELEDGKVHYQLMGEPGDPLIVFIHGGGITGEEVWSKNVSYFINRNCRVLTYDLFGRGYSDRTPVQTPALFQRQIDQLLDSLKLREPFDVVALSMGAIVALDYHNRRPERVKKIVLIDPAASGDFELHPLLGIPVLSDFLMSVYWYPRAVDNQRKEFVDKGLFSSYAERLRYFMDFEGYKAVNYATWTNVLNQDRTDLIAGIHPDSLLIVYGSEDPYFRKGQLEVYQSKKESIRLAKIPAAGHMPNYEQPEAVNRLIHSFLTE